MSFIIKIYETVSQQPNGDRDTHLHPSSRFDVVLVNGERKVTFFTCDQFDSFHCHISGDRLRYLKMAMNKADEMAGVLGGCEIQGVGTTRVEKEIMDTEEEIRRLSQKLSDLKRAGL